MKLRFKPVTYYPFGQRSNQMDTWLLRQYLKENNIYDLFLENKPNNNFSLGSAFTWSETKQGHSFWSSHNLSSLRYMREYEISTK